MMSNIKVEKDIVYDENNNLKLDVYQDPANANQQRRAIIDLHGGGWWQGDKSKDSDWASDFVNQGYIVFVVNYRLAPQYLFPTAIDDVVTAYNWIKNSNYQFDHQKIGAIGMSAGGNLAVELAIRKGIPIASWSGIIDLDHWISTHPQVVASKKDAPNPNTASTNIDQSGQDDPYYKWFVLNYVGDNEQLLQEASPVHRVTKDAGPMFLANSLNELVPTSGVLKLQATLTEQMVPSVAKLIEGNRHGKKYMDDALQPTLDFFDEYLK